MKTQCYISHLGACFEHVFLSFSEKLFCMHLPSLEPLLVLDLSTQWCAFLQFSANVCVFPSLTGIGVTVSWFQDICDYSSEMLIEYLNFCRYQLPSCYLSGWICVTTAMSQIKCFLCSYLMILTRHTEGTGLYGMVVRTSVHVTSGTENWITMSNITIPHVHIDS